jgi:queuosine precursor transporter
MRHYKYLDFIVALFVAVLLLSNLLSSAKIIDTGITIGDFKLSFDAGTLVFPISYIFGDILTEIYGYKRSRRVIWSGFIATLLFGMFVWLAGRLPGESFWQATVGDVAYTAILGGVSGLIVASLIAYFAGEFVNSYVLAQLKVRTSGKLLPLRTILSTLLGQGVDTILFFIVATALGVFPLAIVASLMITNYILKVSIEIIFTPITIGIINWLKKAENEDAYDHDTDFNPFRFEV